LVYLMRHLDKSVFDITVILSDKRTRRIYPEIEKMKRDGIRVIIIPMRRSINPYQDVLSFCKINRHLKRNRYDIVHAHSSKAGMLFGLAAWLNGLPVFIYTPHCFYSQALQGFRKMCFVLLERMMCRLTDRIVVSNNEREYALDQKIAPRDKLVSINNAIDFSTYKAAGAGNLYRAELNIPEDAIVVGSVGRLTKQKDWTTFLYAARETIIKAKNVAFLIIGEGEEMPRIKRQIERLNLSAVVHMPGYCQDMNRVYPAIDIFVNTSRWEGLPYVLAEAMWYQKPIIATDLNYGQIIRDNESGCLVAAGDPSAVSGKILDLVYNEPLRKNMGQMGYCIVREHLSFPKFIQRHQQLYLDRSDQQNPLLQ